MATESTSNLNLDELQDCLVFGYMRQELINESVVDYPDDLNQIIIKFIGCLLLKFDIMHEKFTSFIQDNGTIINRTKQDWAGIDGYTIASSFEIKNGVNIINIKCITPSGSDVIGTVADAQQSPAKWDHFFTAPQTV